MGFVKSINLNEKAYGIWKERFGIYSQEFSKWICEKLEEEFGLNDFIAEKEKELKKELKKIKDLKKIKREKKSHENKKSKEEKEFLQGAKKRVQESPGETMENCRVYNLKFGKKLNLEKFKKLIE